jgi:hypothetical protein
MISVGGNNRVGMRQGFVHQSTARRMLSNEMSDLVLYLVIMPSICSLWLRISLPGVVYYNASSYLVPP